VPTSANVVVILDRIVRRIARWLADEARDDAVDEGVEVLAQVQIEAAATWRSPRDGKIDRARRRASARVVQGLLLARWGCDRGPRSGGAQAVVPLRAGWCSRTSRWRGQPMARSRTGSSGRGPMVAPSWFYRRWHSYAGFAGPSRHRAGILFNTSW